MKISNYGSSGVNPYQRELQKNDFVKRKPNEKTDQLEISAEAIKMQKDVDPNRSSKISRLKAQIESGTYTIDHKAIAEKMYQYYKKK